MRRPELALTAIALLLAGPLPAEEAAERGLEIAREAERRDEGFGDTSATLQMILRNRHGDQTTRQIRSLATGEFNRMVPIVALTANAMKGDKQRCLDAGMNDYLSKPIQLEPLMERLSKYLT